MQNLYSMKGVWARGFFMLLLMACSTAIQASVGFESTHGQTQAIGLMRFLIVGAFVGGVGCTIWAIICMKQLNSERASGSEKLNMIIGFAMATFLMGLGVVIEFNTGAFLGQSSVAAPDGIPDNLWG